MNDKELNEMHLEQLAILEEANLYNRVLNQLENEYWLAERSFKEAKLKLDAYKKYKDGMNV